jgi:RNA recognition motif-containing protein
LPQKSYTSTALAKVIKDRTGYDLANMPQVRRDPGKPFYTAVIKIDNPEKFLEVAQKLRYFQLEDKPCRALPYQTDLLGSNVTRLQEQNLFVRKIPKNIHSEGLEEMFKVYGKIISCKVSINEDYSSRGYGFVCFSDPDAASRALSESANRNESIGVKFAPRSKAEFRKVYNNIFVKNMPDEWTETEIKKTFEAHGRISSLFTSKNQIGTYAFICFGAEDQADREYGPRCAAKAVQEMDNKEIGGKQLYVKPALKKNEREKELAHETLKYKNSKKRCNLYVKGFTAETTEEDLKNLFSSYGEIESLKLFGQKDQKLPFAFVCFKTPDHASQVKSAQLQLNGKPLYINHYEMKQHRDLVNESTKDKNDWQRYQAENFAQFDYQSYDQISSLLRLLMHSVQNKGGMGGQGGPNQRSHSAGGQQQNMGGYQQNQQQNQGGYQGRNQNNYQGGAPRHNNYNKGGQMQNMRPNEQPMQQPMPMPQQMPMPRQMNMPMPMPT